ncbi:MAG: carboxypeptidase regulatory-like domain-containing protein, partial [Planctomycetota bacterium]
EGELTEGRLRVSMAAGEADLTSDGALWLSATLDHESRFTLAAPLTGAVFLQASISGVGQSLPIGTFVAPDAQVDLGDIRLAGAGRIAGRLRLGDGTPLATERVTIEAELVGEPGAGVPGLTSATTRGDAEGRFDIGGLVPGTYQFRLPSSFQDFELLGPSAFPTGTTEAELFVDAWWLLVRARGAEGAEVRMKSIDFGPDAAEGDARGGSLARGRVPSPGRVFETVRATGSAYFFSATPLEGEVARAVGETTNLVGVGDAGPPLSGEVEVASGPEPAALPAALSRFTGFVEADRPSGKYEVELTRGGAGLGAIRVQLTGDGVTEDIRLRLSAVTRGSGWLTMERFDLARGESELAWPGVPPGRYALRASVTSTDWDSESLLVAEADDAEFAVRADATTPVKLALWQGGRYELRLLGVDGADQAQAFGREAPNDDWETLYLIQRPLDEDGTPGHSTGNRFDPSLPAVSAEALAPGQYDLRIECDGYEPVELTVDVRAGEVTPHDVSMSPAD